VNASAVILAIRNNWWATLLGALTGGLVAWGVSLAVTPTFTAHAQLFVAATGSASTSDAYQGGQLSQQRVASYAELLEGEELADRVIDRLDLRRAPEDLAEQITAQAVTNTVLLDVSVTDTSPQIARELTDAVVTEFVRLVDELEATDSGAPSIEVKIIDEAKVPRTQSEPDIPRNVALGVTAGLIAGFLIAFARVRWDRTVKEADDAARLAGAPVIGTVMRDPALEKRHTIERNGSSVTAEAYRQLRINLQFLNVDNPPRVIMVSSALPSEGKTTLAINLALALAEAGQRVVIVEADLRRPRVTTYLGLVAGAGLTNVLAGSARTDEVLQHYGEDKVAVLAGGPTPPNAGELLASSHMKSLLDELRELYDFVLIDVPPLLPVADASGLAAHTDGVLLSVRYGSTGKDHLHQAATTVEGVGGKTLGLILNIVPPTGALSAGYAYDYSYEGVAHPAPS
jgi:capsular exopolysaccharide synthesis family protein